MDHTEKVRVGEEIGRRVAGRFGESVLFGYAAGSVARGDDTERSDLDLTFVTRDIHRLPGMSPDGFREFLHRGLKTQIEFRTKEEVLGILRQTGPYWPFQVADFLEPAVVYGGRETVRATVAEFHEHLKEIPDAAFRKGAGHALLWVSASWAKLQNACDDRDEVRAADAAFDMAHQTAAFAALASRKYYHFADPRIFQEGRSFRVVPDGYPASVYRLLKARGDSHLQEAARDLWSSCERLAAKRGISMEVVMALDEIGL